jgi:hypothetical protein
MMVRARGCCSRATCIGIVLAPEMTRALLTFCQAARATDRHAMPSCSKNVRSSVSSVVTTTFSGSVAGSGQKPIRLVCARQLSEETPAAIEQHVRRLARRERVVE